MKNDEIEILRELVDELNFARQFLSKSDYALLKDEIKKLNEKIDNFEVKLDETLLDETKEYLEKQKRIIESATKDLEAQKNFYVNVLNRLKKENEELIDFLNKNKFKTYFSIAFVSSASVVIILAIFVVFGLKENFIDLTRFLNTLSSIF